MNKQDFINLGGKEWTKDDIERVYINSDVFNKLMGTSLSDGNNKFFFDCKTNKLMRSYKGKRPTIEADYSSVEATAEVEQSDDQLATFEAKEETSAVETLTVDAKPADETADAEIESLRDFRLDDEIPGGVTTGVIDIVTGSIGNDNLSDEDLKLWNETCEKRVKARLEDAMACVSNVSREYEDVPDVKMTIDSICEAISKMKDGLDVSWGNMLVVSSWVNMSVVSSEEIKATISSTPFAELLAASVKHGVPLFIFERVLRGLGGNFTFEVQQCSYCDFVLEIPDVGYFGITLKLDTLIEAEYVCKLLNAGYESLRLGK